MTQIECKPYGCSLSEESCAQRHARAQEPGRAGRARAPYTLCRECGDGRERWVRLGRKRYEAPQTVPDLKRINERRQEVYIPRRGQ
jgi:hypothetical protein